MTYHGSNQTPIKNNHYLTWDYVKYFYYIVMMYYKSN